MTILIIIDFYKNKEKFVDIVQESDKINYYFLLFKMWKKNIPEYNNFNYDF